MHSLAVWFPESAMVKAEADHHVSLSEALSQLSHTLTPLQRLTADNFRFSLLSLDYAHMPLGDPGTLPWFASRVVEVVGSDTVVSLDIEFGPFELPLGIWFLRLEEISYLCSS